ncbi:hypothetical protein BT93_E0809 [Corymbia citriodora subsp. variegata]|nr:hypothetical protein BT93_E0809 [Corymbia citriodora subsp. variegata]
MISPPTPTTRTAISHFLAVPSKPTQKKPQRQRGRETEREAGMLKLNPRLSSITFFHLPLLFILICLTNCNGVSILGLNSLRSGGLDLFLESSSCLEAAIGECMNELEMDWETSRRVLAAAQQSDKKYISYETLKRDAVPCQRSGASYYNCPGGQANQYNRGCTVITGCARNVRDIKT